jgi:N-acetylglucosaminyldiphosphoundecaprenol N-acetyl-beta-D-mannosaminyltransferase
VARNPPKHEVLGTPISLTDYGQVLDVIATRPSGRATVIAVCNVHSVMSARKSPALAQALAAADVTTSDGMPLVWTLRATVTPGQTRVYGPELMRRALVDAAGNNWAHYLYGSTPETLETLEQAARRMSPDIRIVGRHSPPFRPPTQQEEAVVLDDIRLSGADVVWVGLGMPKQELWMHKVRGELPGVALIGVGAAFDLLSGRVKQAPPLIQSLGLEWLYRLSREPRRLWRRYVYNNPAFVLLALRQVLAFRVRRRRLGPGPAAPS